MAGHAPGHHGNRPPGGGGVPPKKSAIPDNAQPSAEADDEAEWFCHPWRTIAAPVRLIETLGVLAGGNTLPSPLQVGLALVTRWPEGATVNDYEAVAVCGADGVLLPGPDGVVVPAAAGMLANWMALSSGGGAVPNVYLRATAGWLLWRGLAVDVVRWEIGRSRGRDLGLDDGAKSEFCRLWYARQYLAAFKLS